MAASNKARLGRTRDKGEAAKSASPGTERHEVIWVTIDNLNLDPLNPRLPDGMEKSRQAILLETLAREYELQELGQSIADNGYFSEEPLVGVPSGTPGKWTVVEGNRRLAALKLLANPDAAPTAYRKRWQDLALSRKAIVDAVPLLPYKRRDEVTPYLGFRHITGVLPWKPYQKARYIAHLVEDADQTFSQIARTIGSKAPTVREHYVAYALLREARDAFAIDTTNVEDSFGVLRRALSDPNIRSFIGLRLDLDEKTLARPVPDNRASEVSDLLSWMFGGEEVEPVLRDSREIRKLGSVLAKSETIDVLRASGDLDHAYELSGGEEVRLIESLNRASFHLDQALPMAIRHKNSLDVILAVRRCRETFREIDRHFLDAAEP